MEFQTGEKVFRFKLINFWILLLVTSSFHLNPSLSLKIEDCSGEEAIAKMLDASINNGIKDCGESDQYCELVLGKNATIRVDFETSK